MSLSGGFPAAPLHPSSLCAPPASRQRPDARAYDGRDFRMWRSSTSSASSKLWVVSGVSGPPAGRPSLNTCSSASQTVQGHKNCYSDAALSTSVQPSTMRIAALHVFGTSCRQADH